MSERLRARRDMTEPASIRASATTRLPDRRADAASTIRLNSGRGIALETILARIHSLPPLSQIALRVLQLADRESISPREIAQVINRDFRFASRVVKAANASYYGLPRPVTSVNEVVMMLGSEAMRHVVLVASIRDNLNRSIPGYGLDSGGLWTHSFACGMASEILAEQTGHVNSQEAFVAGLLHDIGKIILDCEMQEALPSVRAFIESENCAFEDAERAILGVDHADISGKVARHWNIPSAIVIAIVLHHRPVHNRQTVPLAGIVHLADIMCRMAGVGVGHEELHSTLETQALEDLKLDASSFDAAMSRLVDALAAAQTLLAPACTSAT